MQGNNEEAPIIWLEQQLVSEQRSRQAEQEELDSLQLRLGEREAYITHLQGVIEGLKSRTHQADTQAQSLPVSVPSEAISTQSKQELEAKLNGPTTLESKIPLTERAQINAFHSGSLGNSGGVAAQPKRPSEMMKPEYQRFQKLGDLVEFLLNQNPQPITAKDLTAVIYECCSDQEFARARNSLSSELRNGASLNPPRWKKLNRTTYASNSCQSTISHL